MDNLHYFIGTGAKENFYTLRYWFDEAVWGPTDDYGNRESRLVRREYHVQNLSTDRAQAIARAHELTGRSLDAAFDVLPIGERHAVDWSVLQGGKYAGRSIVDLASTEEGRKYLFWLCENCANSPTYAKTVELARPYLAAEYAAKADATAARAVKTASVAQMLAELARDLRDGAGGFRDSLAADMESGRVPQGRAWQLVVEILAKRFGRRGSKAYNAEFERVDSVLARANEI